jgi:AAA15 family ATPase/GTPase
MLKQLRIQNFKGWQDTKSIRMAPLASNLSRDSFQKQWVTNSTFSAFSW